ncbi:hypothetical protein [Methylophaga sulfidovorans]|uniref:Uncharacterized protein n=1 Tax=Methylophaga sulfidovorans TaxID=45496 RepID=A0A1I4AFK3_9GAMM|nr:hypothetical protein [Methylophaga sulfidovorans]SFK54556.1 hypothetical protein SAMN04488079_11432 [Methylophaga sulfidovorans]
MKRCQHTYWANFKNIDGYLFRFDTRIYLKPISDVLPNDECIGAVVGKNPGSASPLYHSDGIIPIDIGNDKLLPTLKSLIEKSYNNSNLSLPDRKYIQVMNLFYLCEHNLPLAIHKNMRSQKAITCKSECNNYPWIWYLWGNGRDNNAKLLNAFKQRFRTIKSEHHFYLDKNSSQIVWSMPDATDFAKHLQGIPHRKVLPTISYLILQQKNEPN